MDQRIESFPADILVLAGEEPDAVREGVPSPIARRSSGRRRRTSAWGTKPLASAARCAALASSRKCINAEERRSQST